MFGHLLRFFQVRGKAFFFQTTALGSRAGLKSLPQTSTTFYDLLLRRPRPVDVLCEAFEVVELIQLLPVEVLIIWARIFLLETQDGVVQDELAFWRIAVVVNKESAFDLLAKIHLKLPHLMRHSSGVATCWGLLTSGSIILTWHLVGLPRGPHRHQVWLRSAMFFPANLSSAHISTFVPRSAFCCSSCFARCSQRCCPRSRPKKSTFPEDPSRPGTMPSESLP